ncbi:hypothetical protein [Paenibacillus methanolicus]|uniref:Uncharacterized protein n=1 Tax=Paenibacillus methanolicus TaxID=582686 RepID=A0A5S5BVJ3_9BACL|nr:hypothetical protein [Paenibacillus methanolicus]TYP69623.1 hypothetical protein BCM02_114140 [Paenibacillus methanolicus]
MGKEWKQFWAQPQYWSLFAVSQLVFLGVALRLLEGWQDIPGMIFFMMAFHFLFLLYGAEQARLEAKHHTGELVSSFPNGARYYGIKLAYWVSHAAFWYGLFVVVLLLCLQRQGEAITGEIAWIIVLYTGCNWLVPFFVYMVLGYALFSLLPSLTTYVALAAVWILLSPYNHFVQLLPSPLLPWLAISDLNFSITQHLFTTEHMMISDGVRWQRLLAVLGAVAIYAAAVPLVRRKKTVRLLLIPLLVGLILIPAFAPNQRLTDVYGGLTLEPNPFRATNAYAMNAYTMNIRHARDDHRLSYEAEISMTGKTGPIALALWDAIHIDELKLDGKPLPYERAGNWVKLVLPDGFDGTGVLRLAASTDAYPDVNATSFELLSTLPWYPMEPEEARDPMGHAKKERYDITLEGVDVDRLVTNLTKGEGEALAGEAYGPTLLNAPYAVAGQHVRLIHYPERTARQKLDAVAQLTTEWNHKLNRNVQLPETVYYVSSSANLSANPAELFIKPQQMWLGDLVREKLFPPS